MIKNKILDIFIEIEDYSKLSTKDKVNILDNIESLIYEQNPIYKYKMVKVKDTKNTYVSLCGKFYNANINKFYKINNTGLNKTFRGECDKTYNAVYLYYNTFIGEIPKGMFLKSHSKDFQLDINDLYISEKSYIEDLLTEDESFTDFNYSKDFYITSKGRVYSKINNKFINRNRNINLCNYDSIIIKGVYFSPLRMILEHFMPEFTPQSEVVFLDNNPYNICIKNLKIVPSAVGFWLEKFDIKGEDNFKYIFNNKYIITKHGYIFSYFNNVFKKLKLSINEKGYSYITITSKKYRMHRLVYSSFSEDNITDFEINHIDGDKLNNNFDNLEKVTGEENIIHYRMNLLFENCNLSYNDMKILNELFKGGKLTHYFKLPKEWRAKIDSKDFNIFKKHKDVFFNNKDI